MSTSKFEFDLPGREDEEDDVTEKQVDFLMHLLKEIGAVDFLKKDLQKLGKRQASHFIDQLIDIRDGNLDTMEGIRVEESFTSKLAVFFSGVVRSLLWFFGIVVAAVFLILIIVVFLK